MSKYEVPNSQEFIKPPRREKEPNFKRRRLVAGGLVLFLIYAIIMSTLSFLEDRTPDWYEAYDDRTIYQEYPHFLYLEYSPLGARNHLPLPRPSSDGNFSVLYEEIGGTTGFANTVNCSMHHEKTLGHTDYMVLWIGLYPENNVWKSVSAVQDAKQNEDPFLLGCVSDSVGNLKFFDVDENALM